MIACSCCGGSFAPTPATYIGSQVWPGSVLAMFNCPNPMPGEDDVCGSTRALVLYREYEDDEFAAAAE